MRILSDAVINACVLAVRVLVLAPAAPTDPEQVERSVIPQSRATGGFKLLPGGLLLAVLVWAAAPQSVQPHPCPARVASQLTRKIFG